MGHEGVAHKHQKAITILPYDVGLPRTSDQHYKLSECELESIRSLLSYLSLLTSSFTRYSILYTSTTTLVKVPPPHPDHRSCIPA